MNGRISLRELRFLTGSLRRTEKFDCDPRLLEPWLNSDDRVQAEVAAGSLQHLQDDDWFHATRGFVEVTSELTRLFRERLGTDEKFHCGFLGHVGMELLLDGVLLAHYPTRFEDYWRILDAIDPSRIEGAVNRMARTPTARLAWFIEIYRREQFFAIVRERSIVVVSLESSAGASQTVPHSVRRE